ncbi:hypothetical protein BAE44_0014414 [Dichanthelium oligosanthes]|uniref:Uncharacterized protein n=1 Tax=Dichanthelium oligosanthes TaxID=888268 RepID=A0A1E5VHI0_9POAL|nr:hypothetical protein BAE44_0014414 [Dichanthelium oligosanthes]
MGCSTTADLPLPLRYNHLHVAIPPLCHTALTIVSLLGKDHAANSVSMLPAHTAHSAIAVNPPVTTTPEGYTFLPLPMIAPLVEPLRSELQRLIVVHLEEVLHPLREEASTIKLWLASLTTHLECVKPHGEHTSIADMVKLFGPCSLVQCSPTSSILASLMVAYTPTDSLVCEDTCVNATDFIVDEIHQMMPMGQAIEVPPRTCTTQLLQAITSEEDVVLVEDTSGDDEAILDPPIESAFASVTTARMGRGPSMPTYTPPFTTDHDSKTSLQVL